MGWPADCSVIKLCSFIFLFAVLRVDVSFLLTVGLRLLSIIETVLANLFGLPHCYVSQMRQQNERKMLD